MAAALAWAPQPELLQSLSQLLTEYRQPGADQQQARRLTPRTPGDAAGL